MKKDEEGRGGVTHPQTGPWPGHAAGPDSGLTDARRDAHTCLRFDRESIWVALALMTYASSPPSKLRKSPKVMRSLCLLQLR